MNKKGALTDLILILAVVFVVFLFAAAFMYGNTLLVEKLSEIPETPNSVFNITQVNQDIFVKINQALPALRWMAFGIFISFVIALMISNFLVKAHPAFFILYILMGLISIVFSAYVSNAYETTATSGVLSSTLRSFTALDYIMMNLPVFMTILAVLGGVMLFVGITVDRGVGGSIV